MSSSSAGAPASRPRRLRLPVPTTIITGALASGKTTAIATLLRSKPPEEVWAVLVNEFGAAGLDAALLEGGTAGPTGSLDQPGVASSTTATASDGGQQPQPAAALEGVHIRQLAGGCLCCSLSNVTALAVAQLLRSVKPDRLVIEPSGLAHPAALLDMLRGGHLSGSLALQPVVCLVDATQFAGGASEPGACLGSQLLRDQIDAADVVVGSKADLCDGAALAAFRTWAEQLFPPKTLIATSEGGQLEGAAAAAALAWPAERSSSGSGSDAGGDTLTQSVQHQHQHKVPPPRVRRVAAGQRPWLSSSMASAAVEGQAPEAAETHAAAAGVPQRREVQDDSGAFAACGWILHSDCMFNRQRLLRLLHLLVPHVLRVKGVFRVGAKTWVAVSTAPQPAAAAAAVHTTAGRAPVGAATAAGSAARGGDDSSDREASLHQAEAHVQLRDTAYRRDSRVELILDRAATATASAAAAAGCSTTSSCPGSSLARSKLDGLSLQQRSSAFEADTSCGTNSGGGTAEQQVCAALGRAAAGDWSALEQLLLAALETP